MIKVIGNFYINKNLYLNNFESNLIPKTNSTLSKIA